MCEFSIRKNLCIFNISTFIHKVVLEQNSLVFIIELINSFVTKMLKLLIVFLGCVAVCFGQTTEANLDASLIDELFTKDPTERVDTTEVEVS